MAEFKKLAAGFAGVNTNKGVIAECYSYTKCAAKHFTVGGFVGHNEGRISDSISERTGRHLTGGFLGLGKKEEVRNCHFLHHFSEDSKALTRLYDAEYGILEDNAGELKWKACGYNIQKVWDPKEEKARLQFQEEGWIYPTSGELKNVIKISTAQEFLEFAQKVNAGDSIAQKAKIVLTDDIDLKGKHFAPIGLERKNSFLGIFDGVGHCIRNVQMTDKSHLIQGLFGYLRGWVINLSVDIYISGEGTIGGIAAVNEGNIAFCGVTSEISIGDKDAVAGGLVGVNEGKIIRSYSAGSVVHMLLPFAFLTAIAVFIGFAILVAEVVWIAIPVKAYTTSIYAPLPEEENQEKIDSVPGPDDEQGDTSEEGTSGGNVIAFGLNQMVEVYLSAKNCRLDFTNPAESTNQMMVSILYVAENDEEVLIAQSGAIRPGYGVSYLEITEEAGAVLKAGGTYEAKVILSAYDVETNSKSMIETQMPVTLNVY